MSKRRKSPFSDWSNATPQQAASEIAGWLKATDDDWDKLKVAILKAHEPPTNNGYRFIEEVIGLRVALQFLAEAIARDAG